MATKVALAAALLVALVAMTTATRYTTTVTTVSVDEANPGQQEQCQRQIQQRQFRNCQRFLSGSRSRSPYRGGGGSQEEDDMYLEMSVVVNPGQQDQYLRQCCDELQNVSQQCQCEALRHIVRQAQQQQTGGSWQGGQSQQVYQRAQTIPRECNFRDQQCRIRAIFV